MKATPYKLSLGLAVAEAMIAVAVAQVPPDRYVQDPSSKVVRDPFGRCVLSLGGQNLPECGTPLVAAKAPPPPAPPVRETMTLGADAYFDFDKATLKPAGREKLDVLARDLRQMGGQVSSIAVVGNTDSVGTDAYNQRLSERRAQAVVGYLVQKGVNPNIVTARGDGERNPVADNATAAGRAQNRRVEVTVEAPESVLHHGK